MKNRLVADLILVLLATCPLLAAGCGGSNYLGGSSVTTVPSVTSGTVDVRSVKGYGDILVTSSGSSLYLLTSDPTGGSSCIGLVCHRVAPPGRRPPLEGRPGGQGVAAVELHPE